MPESEGRKAFLRKQFFRLLPVQILLIAIGCLNSVIDGAVASSHLGADAMAVIGLYSPLAKLVDASIAVFLGGTQILCGRFLGKNEVENTQQAFSLDIVVTSCFSGLLMVLCLAAPGAVAGALGGSGEIRNDLSMYLLGMSFGIPCQMIGSQLSAFLQLERQEKRTYTGIAVMVVLNVGLDLLLVPSLGFLGLGLATSASNLAFCAIQIYFFLTDKATIRFRFRSARMKHLKEILRLGLPGALVQGCLMIRGLVLNQILLNFCAPYGLPAFSAVNAFGCLYCAVYLGMGSATRLLSSVYIGEEDR
ncbi:MAG: polysaccharide biosynthesis C-terminal domain-containing protein, partial [Clostridia bacterium]|nr:polysaccharide biosynthesis C-terminal domain-containing protein [Clostridia bacterium]